MNTNQSANVVIVIIFISTIILILINNQVLNIRLIIYAFLVVIALILIRIFIKLRNTPRNKGINDETILIKPKKLLGKLVLPGNKEFILKDYERKFGREDFLGCCGGDDLLYIGKEHFKLTRLDDGFYIEDMNTKNGTKINGEDVRGLGMIKLKNGDEIELSNIKINYQVK